MGGYARFASTYVLSLSSVLIGESECTKRKKGAEAQTKGERRDRFVCKATTAVSRGTAKHEKGDTANKALSP